MNPETTLAIILLGPPAIFGMAVAFEWWLEDRRAIRGSRKRHPSARNSVPVEDRPDWGQP